MQRTIAFVDDDNEFRENYTDVLDEHGFRVVGFSDISSAEKYFEDNIPDLAILDVQFPDDAEGGFELCRKLRASSKNLPIILLTDLDEDSDIISGMRIGADEFIQKNEDVSVFMVRIQSLLRRIDERSVGSESGKDILVKGSLSVNRLNHDVSWKGKPLKFTLKAYRTLIHLVDNENKVVSVEELVKVGRSEVASGTIAVRINNIRKIFNSVDSKFDSIENVWGSGYKWRSEN